MEKIVYLAGIKIVVGLFLPIYNCNQNGPGTIFLIKSVPNSFETYISAAVNIYLTRPYDRDTNFRRCFYFQVQNEVHVAVNNFFNYYFFYYYLNRQAFVGLVTCSPFRNKYLFHLLHFIVQIGCVFKLCGLRPP